VRHDDTTPSAAERTATDAAAMERAKDLLVRIAADRAMAQLDPLDPAEARFLEWYAREARATLSVAERRHLEESADGFVYRVLARRGMERLRVREVPTDPESAPAWEEGRLAEVVAAAARVRHAPAVELSVAAGAGRELWDEPCDRWIPLPEGTPDGKYVALRVTGDSMVPLLHDGDTILVKLGEELVPDAVVVARVPDGGYVVKRVGGFAGSRVELASLNPDYPPIVIPRDPSLVLGTVLLRWCTHGNRAVA
jgi:phage repressor protein C with HTH and peptisase S24 domain